MNHYKKVNVDTWPRKEHYLYYTEKLKIEFNVTVPVDVAKAVECCHEKGYKFYPVMIYLVTKVVNKIENFRMFKDAEGSLCLWDKVVPNYTIFHDDDKTFSDCWTDFSADFLTFYQKITEDMQCFAHKKGMKIKDNQPPNFYCISCAPWLPFTGCNSRVINGEPAYFPVVTLGKYERDGEKIMMPVNFSIAHAVCDGYHAGLFFEEFQKEIDAIYQNII